MIRTEDVGPIVERVRRRLTELGEATGVVLAVEDRDYRLEDDWLYVVVQPAGTGFRAVDHADLMVEVERELRADHIDNVLLVPGVPD